MRKQQAVHEPVMYQVLCCYKNTAKSFLLPGAG